MMNFENRIERFHAALPGLRSTLSSGRISKVSGPLAWASLPQASLGELCEILSPQGRRIALAEVVGMEGGGVTLLPYGDLAGISCCHMVRGLGHGYSIAVGDALPGCVLNGLGQVLDNNACATLHLPLLCAVSRPAPDSLGRLQVTEQLCTGVRAIDGLLSLGVGQRIGVFAAAGVGKTSLLGMLLRGAEADIVVLALIGERGREVNEFLLQELPPDARRKTIVVVATSDRPPVERLKAAFVATTIAEYFRASGKRVLLLVDSLTRLARAQREIGLASGEPAVRRGFPPSVFSLLPQLLERAGNDSCGSITAIYTVLVEGDDMNEPVADEARSLLDGHIVLSRKLAEAGHFPAIDVLASVSRVMNRIADVRTMQLAARLRELLAKYQEIELLVTLGEYQRGNDDLGDKALDSIGAIRAFLRQGMHDMHPLDQTMKSLAEAIA